MLVPKCDALNVVLQSKGTEVVDSLQYLCSNDVDIAVGGIIHTGMQNRKGGYENDCSLARVAENQYVGPRLLNTGRVHPVASVYDETRQSRYLTRNCLFTCKYYTRLIFTTCFGRDAPSSGGTEYSTSNYESLLNCNINYNKT
jgi:hypothetical protein